MSHCTTWHIRIDLVDDGTGVAARAKLIGAPMAMATQLHAPHDGCLTGRRRDIEYLSQWRALEDLTPVLVDALSIEHRAHAAPASRSVAEPAPQRTAGSV